jgi:hypothetical protein
LEDGVTFGLRVLGGQELCQFVESLLVWFTLISQFAGGWVGEIDLPDLRELTDGHFGTEKADAVLEGLDSEDIHGFGYATWPVVLLNNKIAFHDRGLGHPYSSRIYAQKRHIVLQDGDHPGPG